jgi:hypothetical protein
VNILVSASENVWTIDGEYFQQKSLERWKESADVIVFHYYAFTLYIALLLDLPAHDAIRNCNVFAEAAKGGMAVTFANCRDTYIGLCFVLGNDFPIAQHENLERSKFRTISGANSLLREPSEVRTIHISAQSPFPQRCRVCRL